MCCSNEVIAEPLHQYRSNAEEADNQIWIHAIQSWATNILIYSPDTDVYNKGFGMIHLVWKLLSKMYLFFLLPEECSTGYLLTAVLNDPDLTSICRDGIGITMPILFIITGCGFVPLNHL